MKDKLKRLLSSLLVLALLIQMAPFEALADDTESDVPESVEVTDIIDDGDQDAVDDAAPEVYIEGEVMEARDEYEKHYRLTDGSFMATQFQVPVHYDEDGQWVDIDNTLEGVTMYDGTDVYQAVNGDHIQAFSSTLSDGTVMSVMQGGMALSMALWDGTEEETEADPEPTEEPETSPEVSPEIFPEPSPETIPEVSPKPSPEASPDVDPEPSSETTADSMEPEDSPTPANLTDDENSIEPQVASETEPAEPTEQADLEDSEEVVPTPAPVPSAKPEPSAEPETSAEPEEEAQDEPELPTFNREASAEILVGDGAAVAVQSMDTLRELTDIAPEALKNAVIYRNVFPNVDLKYETLSYNVKESIILTAPQEEGTAYTYSFLLTLDGLTPNLQEDGSILLQNTDGETEYTIPAPYMMDSNEIYSEAVHYALTETEEGWLLTITADESWLNDESRVYPVVIDPTIISKKNESKFVGGTASQNTASTSISKKWMTVGYHDTHGEMRAYFKITDMPKLDPGCTVVNASVGLNMVDYIPQYNSSAKSTLSMHAVTDATSGTDWLTNLTWSNKPAYGEAMDYVVTHGNEIDYILYWDITRVAKGWYEGSTENYGLVLTSDQTSSTKYRAWFDYSGYAILTLTYRNTTGIESYYTYQTQSAGQAGSSYVGDYSSELTVVKDDLSFSNTAMPFSMSHVFNSGLRSGDIYDAVQAGMTAPDYSAMRTGYGWQLSVQESVKRVTIDNTMYLVYRDGDGTQHYFSGGTNSNGSVFQDEDGLGLKITLGTTNGYRTYTMYDDDGNKKFFYNAYLTYEEDGNGNKIYYVYNGASFSASSTGWYPPSTGAYLSAIYAVNKGQSGSTKICSFTYSGNYLSSITDYASRTTKFTYSGNRLTQVTHPDGTIVYYTYSSSTGHLTEMYDAESQYGIQYTYSGNGVSKISEYTATSKGGTKTYGSQVNRHKNGVQEAVYTYDGNDRTFNSSDDIVTRYAFDYSGRTINATTLNSAQTEILGVTAAAYTASSGTSGANNRIEKDAQSGQAAVNLLASGGTEPHDSFSSASSYWSRINSNSGCNAVVKSGELVRTGSNAMKIWLADSTPEASPGVQRHGLYQTVTLTKGTTYTFSAYANTNSITSYGTNGGLYVAFGDTSGNILAAGDRISYTTSTDIEDGWQRVHVTYTPSTSGTYRVMVLQENAYPYGYFDDMQLEVGSAPSSVNLLQNGGFNNTAEWAMGNFSTNSGTSPHTAVITATGSSTAMKRASQTVPINGSAKNTYLLSGWAKASSAANTEEKLTDSTAEKNTSKRYFGLIAKCTYTDATKEYFYMPFNDDYTGWQYASCVIAPKKANQGKTIESITVIAAYDCNINTVYFDDISLRKEPCTTYTYDDKGNVTAVNATGNSGADFTYASGTTKLTKSVTESNGTYTYEYKDSNNDHLVTKIKNDGVSMSITYDAMGNSTATTLSSDSNTSIGSIKTSATYSTDGSQLLRQTNANGYATSYTYDTYRRMETSQDNNGTVTKTFYSTNDRPTMTFQSGVVSTHFYYTAGMLTSLVRGGYISGTDAKQNQYYNLTYDGFGNMNKIAIGSRVLATYDYGSTNQNLKSMTYGNGSAVKYTYDNLDRVILEQTDTTTYEYLYNSEGNLAKKVDKNTGKAVNYEYDSLGRLIRSYQTNGSSVVQRTEHIYDTSNRISRQSWQLGNTTYSESYAYDADDGSLLSLTGTGGVVSHSFGYDALKRLSYRYNYYFRQDYTYRDISSGSQTTTQVASIAYSQRTGGTNFSTFTLGYSYDSLGNISKVTGTGNTAQNASYTYDQQGQLTKEVNTKGTYNYTYDTYGNIRSVSGKETHNYTYGNSEWLDLLTAYDGHSISYDAIGNPTNWYNTKAWNFTWQNGRQLANATSGSTTVSYTYDVAGIRDSKTVGSTVYNYLTQNGKVVRQTWGSHTLDIIYDNQGNPSCCIYDGTKYIYVLNLQGDVIRLVTTTGSTAASYVYDAWGNVISSSGSMAEINPIRYRGYYYDTETKLYYLQSRYYDPLVKRFVNADGYASTGQGFVGYNMFAYCLNCPVMYVDPNGKAVKSAVPPSIHDGYTPPKGGPRKGKDKSGKTGWVDKYGNVWVPVPDGSPAAHGGGHWDVQRPDGKGYTNRYPGNKERTGSGLRPKLPSPNEWLFSKIPSNPNHSTTMPSAKVPSAGIYNTPSIPRTANDNVLSTPTIGAVVSGIIVIAAFLLAPQTGGASLFLFA